MGEKVITAFICLVSVIFFGIATTIPPPHVESPLGSAFWPKLILALLFVSSGFHLIKLLLRPKEEAVRLARKVIEEREREEQETGERQVPRLLVFGIFISFFFCYIVRFIGFTLATPALMAIFLYVTGYRKKVIIVVVSLGTIAVYLLLFVKATFIPLPRGYGIFRSLSILFY